MISCVSFRVFVSSDVCIALWVDADIVMPFEGLLSSSSDCRSLAMFSVEDDTLSAPPAPDRSPGRIYPSEPTREEPREVVPIRKEQVSPSLYKKEPSLPVTPPYEPHVYDAPDTAESTRYPIFVGVDWVVVDESDEFEQLHSSSAAAVNERERETEIWMICCHFFVSPE